MKKTLWRALGPGIIWAGAAIGVSHLVQSTRAGANFGFELVLLVLLFNILKYPFFEFGPRYAIAAEESLVHGYRRIGKWAVYLFLVLTIGTMFTILAAVSAVTIGIFSSIFSGLLSFKQWVLILFVLGLLLVAWGKYKALDRLMKTIVLLLSVSTIAAVIVAAVKGYNPNPEFAQSFSWSPVDIAFLIAMAGWMPSAIDIAVWHSTWTLAKIEQTGYKPSLKEALMDFNIGYVGTVVMAVSFLSLGALTMYGSGLEFAQSGSAFASQFFQLYTGHIGAWAYPIIALAAAATMFSTTMTVIDAYPRVLRPVSQILAPRLDTVKFDKYLDYFWLVLLLIVAYSILVHFSTQMKLLVDIATSLSFITAPVLGYLNYRAVTGSNIAPEDQPPLYLKILSWVGLVTLSGFALYFIYLKIS